MRSPPRPAGAASTGKASDSAGEVNGRATKRKSKDPSPVVARRAAEQVLKLREVLEDWNKFYDGYDPTYSWWSRKSFADADAALAASEPCKRSLVVPGLRFRHAPTRAIENSRRSSVAATVDQAIQLPDLVFDSSRSPGI